MAKNTNTSNGQEQLTEALRLFGFQIGKDDLTKQRNASFAIPQNADGAVTIQAGGIYGTYVDLEGVAKNEIELITRYREMSLQPECENAIDDVVNQAVIVEDQDPPVKLNLEKLQGFSEDFKKQIQKEFKGVLRLLNFCEEGHDIFKRWYIDGRLYYQIMIDEKNTSAGIQELRYIDPRRIRKIREIKKRLNDQGIEIVDEIKEYYIYNERGINNTQATAIQGVRIAPDTICQVNSGLVDSTRNMVLSYLHKAIKPLNQLRMMEDALVIYRLSRAPERRIFYVDVGSLPKMKAEQYIKDLMNKYRNKMIYDAATGEARDDKKFLSLMEDYWLPRREGSKGTEIDTLSGGENLGEITDVNFFQEKLYRSLGVPVSRLKSEGGFNLGKESEINRDEEKFSKFVTRIRNKFSQLFDNLMYVQLTLKGIIGKDDWEEIRDGFYYAFLKDSYYAELRDLELLNNRLTALQQVSPYVGVYFSQNFVKTKILRQTEEEINQITSEIKKEKPLIPDEMEAQAKLQKDLMGFQGDQQMELMGQQGEMQAKQQKQQVQLQAKAEQETSGSQIALLKAQQSLEKTKMAHTQVKATLPQPSSSGKSPK